VPVKFGGQIDFENNSASGSFDFPELDENTKATTFYTTGTTGNPKGVHFTHRQLVLHTLAVAVEFGSFYTTGRFRSNDVYMPLTPMFHVHTWGFPEYSVTDRYVFRNTIPKTSVGKLDKKVLRKQYI